MREGLRIRSFSGLYFPSFGLNTPYLSVSSLNVGKYWSEKLRYGHFSRSVSFNLKTTNCSWAKMLLNYCLKRSEKLSSIASLGLKHFLKLVKLDLINFALLFFRFPTMVEFLQINQPLNQWHTEHKNGKLLVTLLL